MTQAIQPHMLKDRLPWSLPWWIHGGLQQCEETQVAPSETAGGLQFFLTFSRALLLPHRPIFEERCIAGCPPSVVPVSALSGQTDPNLSSDWQNVQWMFP